MQSKKIVLAFVVLSSSVLISLRLPKIENKESIITLTPMDGFQSVFLGDGEEGYESVKASAMTLDYDYYRSTCPQAESIVKSKMADIYEQNRDVSAALLRLFFHDCFIEGCDASVLLDNKGNKNGPVERDAVPNQTLRGFDKIELIKEELEKACPGVVSCADTLAMATREGVVLAGGPFYPVFTGRKDSMQSYYKEALDGIPKPEGNITETLRKFSLRGFNEEETVSLLGAHNIGKIGCEFIQQRLYNFSGTGQPDPTIPADFLREMRINCRDNSNSSSDGTTSMRSMGRSLSVLAMSSFQGLSSSISSGAGFDIHYYQSLLRGRGLLFSDQQLMADERTARFVRQYALDGGSTFRIDFARVMVKMSLLSVLTGSQGQVRTNCSSPLHSS